MSHSLTEVHRTPLDDARDGQDTEYRMGAMYNCRINMPVCIDKILVWPVLFLRRIWYGYGFRRIWLVNSQQYAIVDPADFYEQSRHTWLLARRADVYKAFRFTEEGPYQKIVYMHREIMQSQFSTKLGSRKSALYKAPSELVVDHINRNGLDNRRANLRLVTNRQNNMNRQFKKDNGSSKFKGVAFRKQLKKWRARIGVDNRIINLGNFMNEEEAAKAYDAAALKHYGEYAYLNFPPEQKQKGLRNVIRSLLDTGFSMLGLSS